MKKTAIISSLESKYLNEDKSLFRNNFDPYKFQKRLLNLYNNETGHKSNYKYSSKSKSSLENRKGIQPANIINIQRIENSPINNNYSRKFDLISESYKQSFNKINLSKNQNVQNNIIAISNIYKRRPEERKVFDFKKDCYDNNYKKHLNVLNSLSNFSDTNERLLKSNDSFAHQELKHNFHNKFFDSSDQSPHNRYRKKQTYNSHSKELLKQYKAFDDYNANDASIIKARNYDFNNNTYIKINETTDIPQSKEFIKLLSTKNNYHTADRAKSQVFLKKEAIENNPVYVKCNDYSNKIPSQEHITETNNLLESSVIRQSYNINRNSDESHTIFNILNPEKYKTNISNPYMHNLEKYYNVKNTNIDNNIVVNNNTSVIDINNMNQVQNDAIENYKEDTLYISKEKNLFNNSVERLRIHGAYETLQNINWSNNREENKNERRIANDTRTPVLNFDYSNLDVEKLEGVIIMSKTPDNRNSFSLNDNRNVDFLYKNKNIYSINSNNLENDFNNIQNYYPGTEYDIKEPSGRLEDLEKNIFYLKSSIETNLKNRDSMMERFKQEKSLAFDSNRQINHQKRDITEKEANNFELSSFSHINNTNLISFEKDKNIATTSSQEINFATNSIEMNNLNSNIQLMDPEKDDSSNKNIINKGNTIDNTNDNNLNADVNINNESAISSSNVDEQLKSVPHHKSNFTLGRNQDFINLNPEIKIFRENNSNSVSTRRNNSLSAERYQKINKQIPNELSIITNQTNSNNNINKYINNDYSSNIALTVETVSTKSNIYKKHCIACEKKLNDVDSKNKNAYNNHARIYKNDYNNNSNSNALNSRKASRSRSQDIKINKQTNFKSDNYHKTRILYLKTEENKDFLIDNYSINKNILKIESNRASKRRNIETPAVCNLNKINKNSKISNWKFNKNNIKPVAIKIVQNIERKRSISNANENEKIIINSDNSFCCISTHNTVNSNSRRCANSSSTRNNNRQPITNKVSNQNMNKRLIEDKKQVNIQSLTEGDLLEDNKLMREKNFLLEAKFDLLLKNKEKHSGYFNLDTNPTCETWADKDTLIKEMLMWKHTSKSLWKEYLQALTELKKELSQNKKSFLEQINKMQNDFKIELKKIRNAFETTLIRKDNEIKKLKNHNTEIANKLSIVKEILSNKDNLKLI